jgi:hypothetical protein
MSTSANPNTTSYTGTDMINICAKNPSSCVAAGYAGTNIYWPVAAPTSATAGFPSSGSFYPNIVY